MLDIKNKKVLNFKIKLVTIAVSVSFFSAIYGLNHSTKASLYENCNVNEEDRNNSKDDEFNSCCSEEKEKDRNAYIKKINEKLEVILKRVKKLPRTKLTFVVNSEDIHLSMEIPKKLKNFIKYIENEKKFDVHIAYEYLEKIFQILELIKHFFCSGYGNKFATLSDYKLDGNFLDRLCSLISKDIKYDLNEIKFGKIFSDEQKKANDLQLSYEKNKDINKKILEELMFRIVLKLLNGVEQLKEIHSKNKDTKIYELEKIEVVLETEEPSEIEESFSKEKVANMEQNRSDWLQKISDMQQDILKFVEEFPISMLIRSVTNLKYFNFSKEIPKKLENFIKYIENEKKFDVHIAYEYLEKIFQILELIKYFFCSVYGNKFDPLSNYKLDSNFLDRLCSLISKDIKYDWNEIKFSKIFSDEQKKANDLKLSYEKNKDINKKILKELMFRIVFKLLNGVEQLKEIHSKNKDTKIYELEKIEFVLETEEPLNQKFDYGKKQDSFDINNYKISNEKLEKLKPDEKLEYERMISRLEYLNSSECQDRINEYLKKLEENRKKNLKKDKEKMKKMKEYFELKKKEFESQSNEIIFTNEKKTDDLFFEKFPSISKVSSLKYKSEIEYIYKIIKKYSYVYIKDALICDKNNFYNSLCNFNNSLVKKLFNVFNELKSNANWYTAINQIDFSELGSSIESLTFIDKYEEEFQKYIKNKPLSYTDMCVKYLNSYVDKMDDEKKKELKPFINEYINDRNKWTVLFSLINDNIKIIQSLPYKKIKNLKSEICDALTEFIDKTINLLTSSEFKYTYNYDSQSRGCNVEVEKNFFYEGFIETFQNLKDFFSKYDCNDYKLTFFKSVCEDLYGHFNGILYGIQYSDSIKEILTIDAISIYLEKEINHCLYMLALFMPNTPDIDDKVDDKKNNEEDNKED